MLGGKGQSKILNREVDETRGSGPINHSYAEPEVDSVLYIFGSKNSQIESIGFKTGSSKGKGWRGSRVIAEPRLSIRPIMPIMGESGLA